MNLEETPCHTCFGRGYWKRMTKASPPDFEDDYLEKVVCPDCGGEELEVVVELDSDPDIELDVMVDILADLRTRWI